MVQEFWVFGYGSLMWKPGFRFSEQHQAVVRGLHRGLCIYSHVHRGTPERPGLVMGLDRGGACRGVAFRVEADHWEDTVEYLRAREQVTMVYLERTVQVSLKAEQGRSVTAITSREASEHFMPWWFMEMPSEIEMVVKARGVPPASSTPA